MKVTFKAFALSVLVFASFSTLQAQRGPGRDATPETRATKQTERMKQDLGLTDEQAEKIKEINLKYAQKAEESRKAQATEREKKRAERDAVQAEHQKEIESVLTKEQREKWTQIRKERKEGRNGAPRGKFKNGKRGKLSKPDKMEDQ